jgi:hypothetical protein
MPTKDGFAPDQPLPLFLSEHAEPSGQPWIGKARGRAAVSSRILKTGILVVAAAAIDFAILSVGDPVALFASVTASIQSTVGARGLPPTAMDAPTRDEIADALKTAHQSRTEIRQPTTDASLKEFNAWTVAEEAGDKIAAPADALLKQFQAWAAEKDARTEVGPVPPAEPVQPLRNVPAEAAQIVRAQEQSMDRPTPKRRQVRPARAEIRPVHNPRAKARRQQNARLQARSTRDAQAQDARAQDGSGQNAQAPSFLQSLGLRN